MTSPIRCEVLVIGGGPAGASAAAQLARAGRDVLLVERDAGPRDKVCGEFISVEARGYLAQLGVRIEDLGAEQISRVRLAGSQTIAEAPLPFTAASLSRRVLDEAILRYALQAGVRILRGQPVEQLRPQANGRWQARIGEHTHVQASHVLLATGKHDLRGHPRPAGQQNDLVAFKMHWRLASAQAAALRGYVEIILFPGGYAGLEPIENGFANLCLVVRRSNLEPWPELLASFQRASPLLRERLHLAEAQWPRPLALSHIPYGLVQRRSHDGLWRLGDQATVIPSFAGDGMAIALHSANLAVQMLLDGHSPDRFQQQMARHVARQVQLATGISRVMVDIPWLAQAATLWPGILPRLAGATRIHPEALRKVFAPPEQSLSAIGG